MVEKGLSITARWSFGLGGTCLGTLLYRPQWKLAVYAPKEEGVDDVPIMAGLDHVEHAKVVLPALSTPSVSLGR